MNRNERRQRQRLTRRLRTAIAHDGIEPMLDQMFGPGSWRYDAREGLWIVPDRAYSGPGRAYYCVRANGDWFKAHIGVERAQ